MTAARRRALLVAALVTVLTVTTTGVAFAYWARSGGGSSSVTSGTTEPLVVGPGTAVHNLYPGGVSAVEITVTNPNKISVNANSVSLDTTQGTSGFAVDSAHSGCGLGSLSFATQTIGGVGTSIPSGGPWPYSVANSLSMSKDASNACQGAIFTVFLKVLP